MAKITSLAEVHALISGRITGMEDGFAAVCTPAPVNLIGKPQKGAKSVGYLFTSDMGIESDAELATVGVSWAASGLRKGVGPNPSGILAWRDGERIRVILYVCRPDETGLSKIHERSAGPDSWVQMGSLVMKICEIEADGTPIPIAEIRTDLPPGAFMEPVLPDDAPDSAVLRMAKENLGRLLQIEYPTERHVQQWALENPSPFGEHRAEFGMGEREGHPSKEPTADLAPLASRGVLKPAMASGGGDRLKVDLTKLADRIIPLRKVTFVPMTRPSTPGDAEALTGNVGRAFIPAGTEWPAVKGSDLHLVVQLDVASLPSEARDLLGGTGLFQFFTGDQYDPSNESWLARVVDPSGAGAWQAMPGDAEMRPGVVIDGWEFHEEAPCVTEFSEGPTWIIGGRRLTESQEEAVALLAAQSFGDTRISADDLSSTVERLGLVAGPAKRLGEALNHHGGTKLLGWPSWTQAPEWPGSKRSPMRLLFQFALGDDEGEGSLVPDILASDGTAQVFVSTDGKREFGFAWAC